MNFLWRLLLQQWGPWFPFAAEFCFFCRALLSAIKARHKGQSDCFWFYSLTLQMLILFGGGIVANMCMGLPPSCLMSETSVPIGVLTWILINHCPGDLVYKALHIQIIRVPWVVFTEIYRASAVVKTLMKANSIFSAGKYYPIPIIGPILVGTLGASAGQFLPLSDGLKAIEHQVPWNMQCGFITCIVVHFAVNDPYIIGQYMREYVTGDIDLQTAMFWSILFFVACALMQHGYDKDFNPFSHVHDVLYSVTGVRPSDKKLEEIEHHETTLKKETAYVGKSLIERRPIESFYETMRMVFVFFTVAFAIRNRIPPNTLTADNSLATGDYIGTCTILPEIRDCDPYVLTLKEKGYLALYNAKSPEDAADQTPVWTSTIPKKVTNNGADVVATVTANGRFVVKDGDTSLWASNTTASAADGTFTKLMLDYRGVRLTSNGTLLWSVPI